MVQSMCTLSTQLITHLDKRGVQEWFKACIPSKFCDDLELPHNWVVTDLYKALISTVDHWRGVRQGRVFVCYGKPESGITVAAMALIGRQRREMKAMA